MNVAALMDGRKTGQIQATVYMHFQVWSWSVLALILNWQNMPFVSFTVWSFTCVCFFFGIALAMFELVF